MLIPAEDEVKLRLEACKSTRILKELPLGIFHLMNSNARGANCQIVCRPEYPSYASCAQLVTILRRIW